MRRQVRRANADQNDDYDQRWHREGDSETAGMFWAEIIDRAHDQEHRDGGERDVVAEKLDPRNVLGAGSNVGQSRPAAERGGDG